jgi:hypothetical protein
MKHQIKFLFIFPICAWCLLSIMPVLSLALVLGGCASTQSGTYPTLKQTQINVSPYMTRYRNAAAFGALTLGEKERMNAAYARYQSAFNQALQAAGGNYNAPTPDNVKAQANELIRVLSSIPLPD